MENFLPKLVQKELGSSIVLSFLYIYHLYFFHLEALLDFLIKKYSFGFVWFSSMPFEFHFFFVVVSNTISFLNMAEQLMSGRLCIASMMLGGAKSGLVTSFK